MTITLAAVYVPVAFQGGLTGCSSASSRSPARSPSPGSWPTLSPVMSRYLLHAGGEREAAGIINRGFERIRQTYSRLLEVVLTSKAIVYTAWGVLTLLTVLMFQMAVKELAPNEDQGFLFGIINIPRQLDADQVEVSTKAVHDTVIEVPESKFTFQLTNPGGGFGAWAQALGPAKADDRQGASRDPAADLGHIPG